LKKLSILLVLTILAIITSCTGSVVLDKSNIDSAVIVNNVNNVSVNLSKAETESIIESINKEIVETKDVYKLSKHIEIKIYDAEKNELYRILTADLSSYGESPPQISINKKHTMLVESSLIC